MTPAEYDRFSDRLSAYLQVDERVLALVALGSTAAVERRDVYSDHDFWVVVAPGARGAFLEEFGWLPDPDQIVASTRTGERYVVVLYAEGHVMEVGVFEPEELSQGRLETSRILFDRQGLGERLSEVAEQSIRRPPTPDERSECELLFVTLLTGAARSVRGEHLSAHKYIAFFALDCLLGLLVRNKPFGQPELIDGLDPWRRFEQVAPEVATGLRAAVHLPVIEAAIRLLDIAERELRPVLLDYPARAAETVRCALFQLAAKAETSE